MTSFSEPFSSLRWCRLTATLVCVRTSPAMKEHPFSIIQAIVKGVTVKLDGAYQPDNPHVLFHIKNRSHRQALRQFNRLDLEVFFLRKDAQYAQRWATTLKDYVSDHVTGKNFNIETIGEIEERSLERLSKEMRGIKEEGEICLEFHTPMPFRVSKKNSRTALTKPALEKSFKERFSKLFKEEFVYDGKGDDYSVLPYYWNYTEVNHSSKSQPGQEQKLKGCVGRLYIKGRFKNFLPFLMLGSELHAGGKVGSSQGYYALLFDAPGYFSGFFPRKTALEGAAERVLERYDSTLIPAVEEDGFDFNDKSFVDKLFAELQSGAYSPTPSTAFAVAKKDGSARLVEKFRFKDLVVQSYLLKTLTPVFERAFEECSLGFRRGVSRDAAVAMIEAAVKDGHKYALESDIEDFFPSIDHDELCRLISHYIPDKDSSVKDLLLKFVKTGYILDGTLRERHRGVAQGSPLSPLLTNLYLDSFDEQMLGEGARLVRYADDFVILCRTEKEAQKFLGLCEAQLAELGLNLKKGKTAVKRVADGFTFLGMTFTDECAEKPAEILKRLKKPLYITEPGVFLSLNGGALDVMKNKAVLATFPLRMVSEIMLTERAVISTALAARCVQMNVPVTITLNTGYYVTTIKPDSKAFYDISASHAAKFNLLTDTERLSIAKEFIEGKLTGYIRFFTQRDGCAPIVMELEAAAKRVHAVGTVEELRGIEGAAARKVYESVNSLIDDMDFHIKKRERKSPDRINSLLNFGYYLLFSRINVTVRGCGLNPYLGFLHSPQDNYESFVCDIEELFRPRIDRFIVRLINLKVIGKNDFTETDNGLRLTRSAAKRFLEKFEAEMEKKAEGDSLALKDSIYLQALVFKKWVVDNGRLTFYKWRI